MPNGPPEGRSLLPYLSFVSSLKTKFIAALILLVGVVIGISTWWNLDVHRDHMLQATQDKVRALAEAIERGIQVAMTQGHTAEVQRILEEIARDPDIERILIFDNQGTILRSSKPELVGRRLDRDRLSRYVVQSDVSVSEQYVDGELVQSVVKKIRNRPECSACHGSAPGVIGTLYLDMSFRQTQAQIAEMERSSVWTVILAAAVLAAGGGLLMTRLVDRRIAHLTQTMAKVEVGDLDARATPGGRDELGRLAESFNTMVDRLKAAREEIEVYHEQRLARAERLATLGEVAASLAHEIKNPLAGIAGAVGVMADELPATDPRREIMGEILDQIHRLNKTVQDLLTFARPATPTIAPCDVHQVLDRVLLLLAEDPVAKKVRVVRHYQSGLPRVDADGKQLAQVFLNLLLNAAQAMHGDGQITMTTRLNGVNGDGGGRPGAAEAHTVEVSLTDTGPGIPAPVLPEVFKPFFTTKPRGTGLGLAISRRIIEDHDGWIGAESPPGRGATFRICLPVCAADRNSGGGL